MEMKIKITNYSKENVRISHDSGQVYDFEILDSNKKVIYRWSDQYSFTAVLTSTEIKAGKTLEICESLSGEEYRIIKDKMRYLKAYLTGKAEFINPKGYLIKLD